MNSGPTGPIKSWLDRFMETAILLVIIGVLLNLAYDLIMPLIPFLAITTTSFVIIALIVTVAIRRRNSGW